MTVAPHPTADLVTARTAVVLAARTVVPLTRALADAAARSAGQGRELAVVTPSSSRLTWPLEELLRTEGARWVVQDAGGDPVDGLRGELLAWDGQAYGAVGRSAPPPPAPAESGGVVVDVSVAHPAGEHVLLGGALAECAHALTGEPLAGWGVAEPAASPWDPAALTRCCRERAPQPTALVAVGPFRAGTATVATLSVRRVRSGLLERSRVFVGGDRPPDAGLLDALARRLAAGPGLRTALVGLRPGRSDATVGAAGPHVVLAVGLLAGPEAVAGRGASSALQAPGVSSDLVGDPRRPACWVRLDPTDLGAAERALAHLAP